MKRSSTIILKTAIIVIGLLVLALCILVIAPELYRGEAGHYSPIFILMLVSAIPFFVALNKAWKLLSYIDKNNAFSDLSVIALKHIKYCAITISILYAAIMPYVYFATREDDPPGGIMGLLVVFGSLVIATFSALLQKVLRNAIDIKRENDLVV
jgi:hypothetical protein